MGEIELLKNNSKNNSDFQKVVNTFVFGTFVFGSSSTFLVIKALLMDINQGFTCSAKNLQWNYVI